MYIYINKAILLKWLFDTSNHVTLAKLLLITLAPFYTNICSQKFNVDVRPVEELKSCLGITSHKLEHRINILKDMGVSELNISLLSR